jgi:uncharacterized RmlC-like cupin family protein
LTEAIIEQFATGNVHALAVREGDLIQLAEGWTARLVWNGNIREAFVAFCQDDAVLPAHEHSQVERLYVISGSIDVKLGQTREECVAAVPDRYEVGDSLHIPAHVYHEVSGVDSGDTILFVLFEPRITI